MPQRLSSSSRSPQLIVLANRAPYRHQRDVSGRLIATRSASGVVNAVEPLVLSHSGVWVAEGVGAADREAACDRDGVNVPPDAPAYRLRRVWLTPAERRGYYDGFANSALWPLCHRTQVEPLFYAADFRAYELVNRRFAAAVCDEAVGGSQIVLVQDYHFALAPLLIRRQLPLSRIATFWHIPWPRRETFGICPWSRTLLEGLLGSSSIGFQTMADRSHFFEAVEHGLPAEVDRDKGAIVYKGQHVSVGVFPASIVWRDRRSDERQSVSACRQAVSRELGLDETTLLGVGVDRLDYTKGIERKFLAVERLLERHPQLASRFVFVQLAEPTREYLEVYRQTRSRIRETAARINRRFAGDAKEPIRVLEAHHPPATVLKFLRAADCCYVGSLHDGMNLVSKEFVNARDDEQGVLVLSAFAGAAQELTDALIVNPYDIDGTADALACAVAMPVHEQQYRMRRLRRVVASGDAHHWAAQILADVANDGGRDGCYAMTPLRTAHSTSSAVL